MIIEPSNQLIKHWLRNNGQVEIVKFSLKVEITKFSRNTCLSQNGVWIKYSEQNSFQDKAKVFNELQKFICN